MASVFTKRADDLGRRLRGNPGTAYVFPGRTTVGPSTVASTAQPYIVTGIRERLPPLHLKHGDDCINHKVGNSVTVPEFQMVGCPSVLNLHCVMTACLLLVVVLFSARSWAYWATDGRRMAKDSKIEWTHHTFNPWWGCAKVSPACKHCYAETWAKRVGKDLWGAKSPRRFFSDAHWREPFKWNAEAVTLGERRRVFCASMADVFEARAELDPWRDKLWTVIEATPALDWLLLTKRPHRIASYAPWSAWWTASITMAG